MCELKNVKIWKYISIKKKTQVEDVLSVKKYMKYFWGAFYNLILL